MPANKAKKTTAKKPAKKPAKAKPAAKKRLSALDAAAQVLTESDGSMNAKEMIEAMATKKLWESPNGKTPAATLYAAILRELTTKGAASRFQKTEPGKFATTGATGKTRATSTAEKPKSAAKTTRPKSAKKPSGKKSAESTPAQAATIPDGMPGPESMQELFRI
jgi:hypothetical protein